MNNALIFDYVGGPAGQGKKYESNMLAGLMH